MNSLRKIAIFYFSGTGNAKQIALWFSEFAATKEIQCQLQDISTTDVRTLTPPEADTLLMIISPIHGFNYPKITLDFIRRFPKGKNKVILMNTRGGLKIGRIVTPGLTGIAFMVSSVFLKMKGYQIAGQIPFDMPSNWISLHPALKREATAFIYKKNYYRVEKHFNRIYSGKRDFLAYRDLIQDILISPISFAYYWAGRFILAKSFYASSRCNNCGLCIKQCPVKAIKEIKEHPYWTFKCESCMKCMNSCPEKAIETSHGLIAITATLSSLILSFMVSSIIPLRLQFTGIGIVLFTLIFLVLTGGGYGLQHLLLKKKLTEKMIRHTSLTSYKFWGRYKSIPDRKWKK